MNCVVHFPCHPVLPTLQPHLIVCGASKSDQRYAGWWLSFSKVVGRCNCTIECPLSRARISQSRSLGMRVFGGLGAVLTVQDVIVAWCATPLTELDEHFLDFKIGDEVVVLDLQISAERGNSLVQTSTNRQEEAICNYTPPASAYHPKTCVGFIFHGDLVRLLITSNICSRSFWGPKS